MAIKTSQKPIHYTEVQNLLFVNGRVHLKSGGYILPLSPIILEFKYLYSSPKIISHRFFFFYFVASKLHAFSDAKIFGENPYLEKKFPV